MSLRVGLQLLDIQCIDLLLAGILRRCSPSFSTARQYFAAFQDLMRWWLFYTLTVMQATSTIVLHVMDVVDRCLRTMCSIYSI